MWLLCFIVVVLVSSGASTTGKMTCGAGDDLCATPSDRHILKRHSGQPESMVSVKSASCHQQQVSGCGGKERLELGPCRMLANGPKAKALGVAVQACFPHGDYLVVPSAAALVFAQALLSISAGLARCAYLAYNNFSPH